MSLAGLIVALKFELPSKIIGMAEAAVGKKEVAATPIVLIYDTNDKTFISSGSGTVIDSRGYVLTNEHVVSDVVDDSNRYRIFVVFTTDPHLPPSIFTGAIVSGHDKNLDLALLKVMVAMNSAGNFVALENSGLILTSVSVDRTLLHTEGVDLGDQLQILGYPGFGGDTITYTSGTVSGFQGLPSGDTVLPYLIKTDAKLNPGNSGGGVYDAKNKFVGVAKAVAGGNGNIGYVISLPVVNIFLSTNLSGADEPKAGESPVSVSPNLPDADLINRLKGYILLQVESHGEAWYVNPDDGNRYYMSNGAAAFNMMRHFGLGISNADIAKIPTINDVWTGDASIIKRTRGKILLQVEHQGDAWYLYPGDNKRYFLAKPDDAYKIMRILGLGVSDANLAKIPIGSLAELSGSTTPIDCSAVSCTIYGPLSRPVFDSDAQECRCGCLSGATFNNSINRCLSYSDKCNEDYPGSAWNGNFNDAGNFICDCPSGYVWDQRGTSCVAASSSAGASVCEQNNNIPFSGQCYPKTTDKPSVLLNMVAGDGEKDGCEINHGTGANWDFSAQRCVCNAGLYATTNDQCRPVDLWCQGRLGINAYFNSNLNICVCMPNHAFVNGQCT